MHHCLEVDDIFAVVVNYAYESRLIYDAAEGISVQQSQLARHFDTGTVLALALTCRSFTDTALNRLWHSSLGIDRVLQTLPADAWRKESTTVHITRPLTIADWERFDYYGGKIRVFKFDSRRIQDQRKDSFGRSLNRGYHHLFTERPKPLLFSQLRDLTWLGVGDTGLAPLFVGQQLESLNLTLAVSQRADQGNTFTPEDLKFVLDTQPRLKFLFLYSQMIGMLVSPNLVLNVIHSSSDLCIVRVDMKLSSNDLIHIALMPSLVEFHFVADSNDDLAPLLTRDQPLFPSLRVISLGHLHVYCGADVSSCAALLDRIHSSVLQDVSLEATGTSSSAMRRKLLSSMHKRYSALRKLHVVGIRTAPVRLPLKQDAFGDDELVPLLSLTSLTHLQLSFICQYDLGDLMMLRIADGWPGLQSLKIGTVHGWEKRSRVTLHGLIGLIKSCPQLRELALPIDISQISLDLEHDELPQNHHITTIDLMDSAIVMEDENILDRSARCFVVLFPELRLIRSSRPRWQLSWHGNSTGGNMAQVCWVAIADKIVARCPTRRLAVTTQYFSSLSY
ncbi:uncharacterized protein FIBRA_05111 [Fibroporia radiculosa]|uniref:F-box domain-containing protein n=1 Tax=Fibroporia radiculosa TaxID=599839 RepID=J4IAJ0_9APHY|nr:uncharacterized protein FIBRA_05111 [Fibroporia radiculosa]CCM02996.1 predicted protein [Fibroporia radiculosa]